MLLVNSAYCCCIARAKASRGPNLRCQQGLPQDADLRVCGLDGERYNRARRLRCAARIIVTDDRQVTLSNISPLKTRSALRVALAVSICLICAERLHMAQSGLAVWSTYMVIVQHTFSTLQKGIERILGRGLGIFLALVLATLTRNAWGLGFVLEMLAIVPLFYFYFSDRLAYTFLNAGLYLASMTEIARSHPDAATTMAGDLFAAITLGVVVAVLVDWISGAEHDIALHTEGKPLWPLDRDRVLHSLMLMFTVALVQLTSHVLHLSTSAAIVSVMLLTITPDYQSLLRKGELRIAGAALAILYAMVALVLLVHRPSFPLLVGMLFLGTFLATLLAQNSDRWSYAGLQMGLVLPMILVAPHEEFGSLSGALARVGGAVLAMAASIVVGIAWALLAPAPPLPRHPGRTNSVDPTAASSQPSS